MKDNFWYLFEIFTLKDLKKDILKKLTDSH
jgi:hypothetical protein